MKPMIAEQGFTSEALDWMLGMMAQTKILI